MEAMSQNCSISEKNMYWKEFESKRHQFFKRMVGEFRHHLRIPRKFMHNFRENLSGTIHLRGPSGFMWTVELIRMLDDIFDELVLLNGWEIFAKDHRLAEDDVLVFRYDGDLTFNVVIFDKYGCEREGSYFVKKHMNVCSSGRCVFQKEDGHEEAVNLDKIHENHMQKEKIKGRRRPSSKSAIENPFFTVVMQPTYIFGGGNPRLMIPNHFAKKYLKKSGEVILKVSGGRTWMVNYRRNECPTSSTFLSKSWRAFVQGNNLKVGDTCKFKMIKKNEMSFEVVIFSAPEKKQPQVGESSREGIEVPSKDESDEASWWAMEASEDSGNESVSLKCQSKRKKGEMQRLADLHESHKIRFKSNRREITEEEKLGPCKLARQHSSARPSFFIIMSPSYVYEGFLVNIPRKWQVKHFSDGVRRAELRVPPGEKIWPVKILSSSEGRKWFLRGWAKFVKDNNLEEHDVCVFELNEESKANGEIVFFDVIIFRVLDEIVPLTDLSRTKSNTSN